MEQIAVTHVSKDFPDASGKRSVPCVTFPLSGPRAKISA